MLYFPNPGGAEEVVSEGCAKTPPSMTFSQGLALGDRFRLNLESAYKRFPNPWTFENLNLLRSKSYLPSYLHQCWIVTLHTLLLFIFKMHICSSQLLSPCKLFLVLIYNHLHFTRSAAFGTLARAHALKITGHDSKQQSSPHEILESFKALDHVC